LACIFAAGVLRVSSKLGSSHRTLTTPVEAYAPPLQRLDFTILKGAFQQFSTLRPPGSACQHVPAFGLHFQHAPCGRLSARYALRAPLSARASRRTPSFERGSSSRSVSVRKLRRDNPGKAESLRSRRADKAPGEAGRRADERRRKPERADKRSPAKPGAAC
jgi:hypothetical protein